MPTINSSEGTGAALHRDSSTISDDDIYAPEPHLQESYSLSFANGPELYFGEGRPVFTISVPSQEFWSKIQRAGTYAVAASFVKGDIEISGDLIAAARWWTSRRKTSVTEWITAAWRLLGSYGVEHFLQSERRASANIRFHYDLPAKFYKCFLDKNLVYSCPYFRRPSDILDEAQISKLEHICRKLELGPEDAFLDVGCGWGALLLHAVKRFGVTANGCTLSREQYEYSEKQIIDEGWGEKAKAIQSDYRSLNGTFSKIASVGMFEHVGRRRLSNYFRHVYERLRDDGLFLNHGIIRPQKVGDGPETVFLRKHVFPGGELAHLADVVLAAEDAGFEILDIEGLRPHYALTCRHWVSRLQLSRSVALKMVSPEVWRTWLLYLAASSASFADGQTDVYQILMSKRQGRRSKHLTRAHIDGIRLDS